MNGRNYFKKRVNISDKTRLSFYRSHWNSQRFKELILTGKTHFLLQNLLCPFKFLNRWLVWKNLRNKIPFSLKLSRRECLKISRSDQRVLGIENLVKGYINYALPSCSSLASPYVSFGTQIERVASFLLINANKDQIRVQAHIHNWLLCKTGERR